ncbi:unnamed protein product, partial [Closterium sp. Naga37s-1]
MGWGEEDRAAWPVVEAGRRAADAAAMAEKPGALEAEKSAADPFPPGAHRAGGVLGRKGVKAVAASGHTLAVTVDGTLYSFGRNWDSRRRKAGQLGRKGPFGRPGRVGGVAGRVRAVAAGKFHSVAVTEEGVVYTWGCNGRGQLGRQTRSMGDRHEAAPVRGALENVVVVAAAAGPHYSLALSAGGQVFTWGLNLFSLPAPWTHHHDLCHTLTPASSAAVSAAAASSPVPFSGRQARGSASEGGVGKCGGGGSSSRPALLPRPLCRGANRAIGGKAVGEGERVVKVAAGEEHWLALTDKGHVYACRAIGGKAVGEGERVVKVAAGGEHWLALTVKATCMRADKAIGGKAVGEGERVVKVAAGEEHWLALTDKGHVYECSTGFNASGIRVNPAIHAPLLAHSSHTRFSLPHRITSGPLSSERASTIGAAAGASFAVMASSQQLLSWGYGGGKGGLAAAGGAAAGHSGSVLLGRTGGAAEEPSEVVGEEEGSEGGVRMGGVVQVVGGASFVLARTATGQVFSWGYNNYHQLGRPTQHSADPLPGLVGGLACLHVDTVAAGSHHGLVFGRAERGKELEVVEMEQVVKEEWERVHSNGGEDEAGGGGAGERGKTGLAGGGGGQGGWGGRGGRGGGGKDGGGSVFPVIYNEHHRGEIMQVAGEWYSQLPPSGFDPSFRNPCWKDGSGFHCLPYFLVIGAMRSGARDFFQRLTMAHPTALQPASMLNLEWWDMREYDPFDWYTEKFQEAAAHIATHPAAMAGEVTPSLLTHSGILARGPHARSFLLPELVFSLLPHARFIVLLRNPIHRWFSSFLSAKQHDDSHIAFDSNDNSSSAADAFARHVDAVLPAIKGCMVDHSPVYCSRLLFHSFPHVCRSMYAYFLS